MRQVTATAGGRARAQPRSDDPGGHQHLGAAGTAGSEAASWSTPVRWTRGTCRRSRRGTGRRHPADPRAPRPQRGRAPRCAELTGADVRALDPAPPARRRGARRGRASSRCRASSCAVLAHPRPLAATRCRFAPARRVLTGDTILGRGTTVVAHPDGVLADYLRVAAAAAGVGDRDRPARARARAAVTPVRSRRSTTSPTGSSGWSRCARRSPPARPRAREVVEVVYADVDRVLWLAAELSVRAQLDYLSRAMTCPVCGTPAVAGRAVLLPLRCRR